MRLQKNGIYSIAARNSSTHFFHDDFNVCHILQALKPFTNGLNFCPSRVTEISFRQNLLAKDQTRCFVMLSMSVGYSHTLSSLPRITNCVHYESFKNCIYSKLAGNSSNHLFHDVFDVRGTFLYALGLYDTNRTTSLTSHCKSRFVRSCWQLTKPGSLLLLSCLWDIP